MAEDGHGTERLKEAVPRIVTELFEKDRRIVLLSSVGQRLRREGIDFKGILGDIGLATFIRQNLTGQVELKNAPENPKIVAAYPSSVDLTQELDPSPAIGRKVPSSDRLPSSNRLFVRDVWYAFSHVLEDLKARYVILSPTPTYRDIMEGEPFEGGLEVPRDSIVPIGTAPTYERNTGLLRVAVDTIRKSIPVLKKELSEQDNRTPWLLPKRNFKSAALLPKLAEIQQRIGSGEVASDVLGQAKKDFIQKHPFQRVDGNPRACFVDGRGVEFHAPGKDRHGFARPGPEKHPLMCLVAGRRRLGAPYDRAFHYDCARGAGRLIGHFASCHAPPSRIEGDPHLNIAPNDFVRR
jgi:hypothetical protein